MPCPSCGEFLRRVKGYSKSSYSNCDPAFEDVDHHYSRLMCSNCGLIWFASGNEYHLSLKYIYRMLE